MAESADGKMSFFDHLTELRNRIIWSLIPAGIGLVIALYFTDRIMVFLQGPLIILYEVGIISARIFGKRTPKPAEAAEPAAVDGAGTA